MIQVGKKPPAFTLSSSDGKIAVIYFYPRDNTSGCTIEAQDFTAKLPEFKKLGAVVYGVSKDSIESHCKFRDKYGLTFPLLTDPNTKMMEAWNAWGDKVLYGKKSKGIIRSTVLLGTDGKVVKHWPKVTVKGHADAVLEAVKELAESDED